ncbi:MAG: hypothetical protein IPL46_02500 [Saprospiraceae bacterium]|nr:hypothetical protein [Saprospiraceae bacterium]
MITVNSIILSLLVGGVIGKEDFQDSLLFIPPTMLALTSIFSIFFAVMAIRPNKTQGTFTEDEIQNKEGNLLYFGNFHDMPFQDYKWGIQQMIKDSDYMYNAMTKDVYYLGQTLSRKYKGIRLSLNIFIIGFVISVFSMLAIQLFLA